MNDAHERFVHGLATAPSPRRFINDLDRNGALAELFSGLDVNAVPDVLVSSSSVASRNAAIVLAVVLDHNPVHDVVRCLGELGYGTEVAARVGFMMRFRDIRGPDTALRYTQLTIGISDEELCEYCLERGMPSSEAYVAYTRGQEG